MTARRTLHLPRTRLIIVGALCSAVSACGRDSVTAPRQLNAVAAVSAKSSNTLSVTSASPAFGDQGTTRDVHVYGTGFTAGAQATWLLHGAADPVHVRTNSTTVLSSTEIVANITIASDATLDFWDVQVSLSNGKNGVGSECFEVTSAQILGAGASRAMNDNLQIVGLVLGSTETAFFYEAATGVVTLGAGQANDIDQLGTVVVGCNASFGSGFPTAWTRQSDNSWRTELLPRPAGSIGGVAYGVANTATGTLAVGWDYYGSAKKHTANTPSRAVAWQRAADGTWSAPQIYSIPATATSATAWDVNARGEVVGTLDDGGIFWDSPTSYTVLEGTPKRINPAGTLIVGQTSGGTGPAYWWRDPVTAAWNLVPLPTPDGCTGGVARAVNDAGVIVGSSCSPSGGADQPTVWQLDLSGPIPVLVGTPTRLPGLGIKTVGGSAAQGVTSTAPYIVGGNLPVDVHGALDFVRWNLR